MAITTRKFSEFLNAGLGATSDIVAGLSGGTNAIFTLATQFGAAGTTAQRPVAPDVGFIRLNTDLLQYEWWDGIDWVQFEDSGDINALIARLAAHTDGDGASMIGLEDQGAVSNQTVQDLAEADFIVQSDTAALVNAFALSTLATGFMAVTTGTGALASRILTGTANQITITNGDGSVNPQISIPANPIFTGTSHVGIPNGTTAQRPGVPQDGYVRYNETTGFLEYWSDLAADWVWGAQVVVPTVDMSIARFNGVDGELEDSGVLISDSDNILMATSTGIQDLLGNYYLRFATLVTPESNLVITQGDAAGSPVVSVEGVRADLGIRFQMKGDSAYLFQGTSTSEANINMQEQTTNGSDAIALSPPAALTASYNLTFPANVAAVNNEFLQSTTVGVLSWTGTEADWTPVPRGSVTAGSPAGTFVGKSKRIGNRIWFSAQIVFTSLDTMAGNFIIGGFPATIIANSANRNGFYCVFKGNLTNDFAVMGFGGAGTTDLNMYNAELGNTPMVIGDLSATTNIYIAGVVIVS